MSELISHSSSSSSSSSSTTSNSADNLSCATTTTTTTTTAATTLKDFCLTPVGLGCDRLREVVIPCVSTNCTTTTPIAEIRIGRADIKDGKYHTFISREHIVFTAAEGTLSIRSIGQAWCVCINNRAVDINIDVAIEAGDIVCLLGPKQYFNFEVLIIDHVEKKKKRQHSTDAKAAGTTKKSKATKVLHNVTFKTGTGVGTGAGAGTGTGTGAGTGVASSGGGGESEDVKSAAECAICLELMAVAYSVVPCGHNFCYVCITEWQQHNTKCPTCSCVVSNKIPCRVLDDIIQSTVIAKQATDVGKFGRRYTEGLHASRISVGVASISKPAAPKNKIHSFFDVVDLS
jgi:hypothetical protein